MLYILLEVYYTVDVTEFASKEVRKLKTELIKNPTYFVDYPDYIHLYNVDSHQTIRKKNIKLYNVWGVNSFEEQMWRQRFDEAMQPTKCRGCGSELKGKFCHECGDTVILK